MSYTYIRDNEMLAEACARWATLPLLALDTEFIRTDTFYPIIGLYQVNDGSAIYLLDPLAIADWEPFRQLLLNPQVVKLFHSCSEDLEVIQRHLDVVPAPLLDTQVGAALAGLRGSMSYQNLVAECLDEHVPKGETRSDWLQRPLSDSQCEYAALDVHYLLTLHSSIVERLNERDRLPWWQEEGERMVEQARAVPDLRHYYRKISSAWKLSRRQQAVLQQLCEWRELQARKSDVPRGRIIKDALLLEIAQRSPCNLGELAAIRDLPAPAVRKYGETILDIIDSVQPLDEGELPEPLPPAPAGERLKMMKAIQKKARAMADSMQLPPEMLMSKRDLLAILQLDDWSKGLQGWREPLLAPLFREMMEAK